MESRKIKVIATDEYGVVLDSIVIEIEDAERNTKLAVRPVNYSIGKYADEEILTLGKP